jgi:hypothetical protein
MRQSRSLGFDDLETRKLLSKIHHPAAEPKAKAAAAPAAVPMALNLNGTLLVDMKAASQSQDEDDDTTTTVPVSGTLGSMGKVHGEWNESVDEFGDYLGPDTIEFANSQGTYTISFNSANLKNAHKVGKESIFPTLAQELDGATGIYAKASETGSIQVTLNPSKGVAETMTIVSATAPTSG